MRHSFGISGTVLDWIASYLTGRTQFVRFNGHSSKTAPVTSGVPQDSVLGPILFLTYTAEVVLVVRKHGFNIHAYADDLQIYDHTAPSGMAGLLQRMAVEDVSTWMSLNRLCLNPSKTELIWLGSSRRLQNCATDTEMSVLGFLLRPVDSGRDSACTSTAALPCLIMSTKSPRCVTSIFDNFASCDEHWRMRLHTPWYEPYSTTGLITATVFWLPVRNTSLRSYSRCFVSPLDSSYDCPVSRPFPLRCAINFTGWASNKEWSLSWLSWLTSRFTVWFRSTCLPTVFQCRASAICWSVDHARPQN